MTAASRALTVRLPMPHNLAGWALYWLWIDCLRGLEDFLMAYMALAALRAITQAHYNAWRGIDDLVRQAHGPLAPSLFSALPFPNWSVFGDNYDNIRALPNLVEATLLAYIRRACEMLRERQAAYQQFVALGASHQSPPPSTQ